MKNSPFYIVAFMVLMAAVFGAGVTGIYLASQGTLERNRAFLRERSLVEAFGIGDTRQLTKNQVLELVEKRIEQDDTIRDPESGWETPLLKAYEPDGKTLIGYGFMFRGPGFWAPIEGILAVSPDLTTTIGMTIVQQAETPGLGGRITEPIFTKQFREGILISPPENGPHIRVGAADKANPRQVDAITGATQTSMAMERILNDALEAFHRALSARGGARSG